MDTMLRAPRVCAKKIQKDCPCSILYLCGTGVPLYGIRVEVVVCLSLFMFFSNL